MSTKSVYIKITGIRHDFDKGIYHAHKYKDGNYATCFFGTLRKNDDGTFNCCMWNKNTINVREASFKERKEWIKTRKMKEAK